MKKRYSLGVVGGGFMAKAIVDGATLKGVLSPEDIAVSEPSEDRRALFSAQGIDTFDDNAFVAANCDYLLLAVKPQIFPAVAKLLDYENLPVIISIMAGKTKRSIAHDLSASEPLKIARAMPNLPCSVGEGMTGLDINGLSEQETNFVRKLFSAVGRVALLDETLLNAVTGVSGSGPAYVFLFLQSLMKAGEEQGLSKNDAYTLALQTLKGGLKLVENRPEKSLDELISAVSSKGGTTVAALESFANDGFQESVSRAVSAAVQRAEELSQ